MNTVEEATSLLKQNLDLALPIVKFLRVQDRLRHEPVARFADAEATSTQAARELSCACHAGLLSRWDLPAPPLMIHDGQRFERTHQSTKTYQGLDGPVPLERWLYTCERTGHTICPLELRAGLPEGRLTPAAARLEFMSAASDDYRKANDLHQAACVLGRSKSSHERDVVLMGAQMRKHLPQLEQVRREVVAAQPVDERVCSISVSVDRTGAPFEEEVARGPGRPRKGAPKKTLKVVKRQTYCACLTLHDEQGEALSTQRFAGLPDNGDEVVEHARRCLEVLAAKYPRAKLVGLCDGAAEMARRVDEIMAGCEPDALLVDAWHAASYVSKAYEALGCSEAERKRRTTRFINNDDGLREALVDLRIAQMRWEGLEALDAAVTYLENNGARMKYAKAREMGLPIGSGNVEATCKCVVAVRFKRSGARWKPEGAEPLLHTRAWMTSDADVWPAICDAFLDTYVTMAAA